MLKKVYRFVSVNQYYPIKLFFISRYWWRFYFVWMIGFCPLGFGQGEALTLIEKRFEEFLVGSDDYDYSNEYLNFKYRKMLDFVDSAKIKFDQGNLKYDEINSRTDIWRNILFPLVMGYHIPGSKEHPNPNYKSGEFAVNILKIINRMNKFGWDENQDMGWNKSSLPKTGIIGVGGTYANKTAPYAISIFLMRDFLSENGVLERELETLNQATAIVGPQMEHPILWEVKGFNVDLIIGSILSRLCYILSLDPGDQRVSEMQYIQKLLNKGLRIADGFADFIKSDFTTNHHKNAYVSSYGNEGLQAAATHIYLLNNTPFQLDEISISNVSRALLAARIFSNKYTFHRGVSGRSTVYDTAIFLTPALAQLSTIDSPFQEEIRGAFLRFCNPQYPQFKDRLLNRVYAGKGFYHSLGSVEIMINEFNKGGIAEEAPNGHWYFHYAGLSVHRRDQWSVMWKGIGKYLWDYEGPLKKNTNIYGKYSGAGALTILNSGEPISEPGSGIVKEGWDWRRVPGTTAVNAPFEKMTSKKHRQFSSNSFIGGITIDGNNGISSFQYRDPKTSLKANKSVFYFDDYVVALGSDIESVEEYSIHTTLFQTALVDESNNPTYFNGKSIKKLGYTQQLKNQSIIVVDAVDNAYFVPLAKEFSIERIKQKMPDHTGLTKYSHPYISGRLMHGKQPSSEAYEYYIQINGGKKGAHYLKENYLDLFAVHQKDYRAHIVEYIPKKLVAYAIMTENDELSDQFIMESDTPCIAMINYDYFSSELEIAVMNPEVGKIEGPIAYKDVNNRETWHAKPTIQPVVLTLKGEWKLENSDSVEIIHVENGLTQIKFDCIDGKKIIANIKSIN